jgi:hypothetical protein
MPPRVHTASEATGKNRKSLQQSKVMSSARYLLVAHCEHDDHPISLHEDLQSAQKAAAEATPELVGRCASFSTSRTGRSRPIQPINMIIFKFENGSLIEVPWHGPAHAAKNLGRGNELNRRSSDDSAEYAVNQSIHAFPSPAKPPASPKVQASVRPQPAEPPRGISPTG